MESGLLLAGAGPWTPCTPSFLDFEKVRREFQEEAMVGGAVRTLTNVAIFLNGVR